MGDRLGRDDWLRAARLALLRRGPEGVRVEPLARELGVTKGSFYWHFHDRKDLLEALLVEWEQETSLLTEALRQPDPLAHLPAIVAELKRRNSASERGDSPSDAAIFAWAAGDPEVARRANRIEANRMRLFRKLTKKKQLADLFFYAYHGFLLRRRRAPKAARDFEAIARLALRAFAPGRRTIRQRRRRTAAKAIAVLCCVASLQGCTECRIIRLREPHAHKPVSLFPQRVVRHSEVPSRFPVASPLRTDLDTVTVRDVDFRLRPFSEYVRDRHIKAFVVIQNDTLRYELYRDGYTDSTLSSSFSAAKSITSALLGLALDRGLIGSLDDPVTRYVPELAMKPDFRGVTIRHLLEMTSGFAYTRTTGNPWHDLRSSDAHFYHTRDLHSLIASQRRESAPGERWAYKDSDTELLAWVLERATGRSLAAQFEEGVWRRIGTERDASWDLDREEGSEKAASGLNSTARDLARFGQLYLDGGAWEGAQVLPHEWVASTTSLDTTRAEPEVATWWLMQHHDLWWIPMQDWDAEEDFFADGSRGQRIYVNRRLRTVIVQLADHSAQDFPFRKIAHYLAERDYSYPRVIANQLYAAIERGASADSVRSFYRKLRSREQSDPAAYSYSTASMQALERRLDDEDKREMAAVVRALGEATRSD